MSPMLILTIFFFPPFFLFSIVFLFSCHSPSHSIDCIIVACLRRVQEWSFVSILGELRMHSGCRQFDVEQFIESFDPDIVDISQYTPDYLRMHIRLKVCTFKHFVKCTLVEMWDIPPFVQFYLVCWFYLWPTNLLAYGYSEGLYSDNFI